MFWLTGFVFLQTDSCSTIILTFPCSIIHFRNFSIPKFAKNTLIHASAIYFFHLLPHNEAKQPSEYHYSTDNHNA